MTSFPVSFILGILGIIFDKRKVLAMITTIITGALITFFLLKAVLPAILSC
jgi:energy-converting hydrogenase Eha subunit E